MFEIVALLVLAPLLLWYEQSQRFQRLTPVEQNLQRASHGFALMVFVLFLAFGMYGVSGVVGFFSQFVANPGDHWIGALIFGGVFVYGLVRFLAGVHRSAGVRDWLLAFRALVKIAVGIVAFVFLWRGGLERLLGVDFWAAIVLFLLLGGAWWCILTGAVRFLLTLGIRRRQKAPPLHPSPRGAARDASPAEAKAAMQGSGGRKISLDKEMF